MKNEESKEFICRNCMTFLDSEEFSPKGVCPECGSDEIYLNDLLIDSDIEQEE